MTNFKKIKVPMNERYSNSITLLKNYKLKNNIYIIFLVTNMRLSYNNNDNNNFSTSVGRVSLIPSNITWAF